MSAHLRPQLIDGQDTEIAQYRALSGWAVAGLILGLLSPFWVVDPLMWILPVPLLGIACCGVALWQIRRNAPGLIGRKAALAGLILSILFGTAAPGNWLAYRRAIRREAQQFAGQWFDFLAHNQPRKAFQLTRHPLDRPPADDQALDDLYRRDPNERKALDDYRAGRPIRAMTTLGEKARVRYYQTSGQMHADREDFVSQVYAVTYEDPSGGGKKTFFLTLTMQRIKLGTGVAEWRLTSATDGFRPPGL